MKPRGTFSSTPLQLGVLERPRRILLELAAARLHQARFSLADRRRVGLARQHLGHVTHLDIGAFARQLAGHVHQASEIAGEQRLGAACRHIGRFLAHHVVGDFRIFDAERAAEAAAHLRILHLGHFQAPDLGQKPARLAADVELAQARQLS